MFAEKYEWKKYEYFGRNQKRMVKKIGFDKLFHKHNQIARTQWGMVWESDRLNSTNDIILNNNNKNAERHIFQTRHYSTVDNIKSHNHQTDVHINIMLIKQKASGKEIFAYTKHDAGRMSHCQTLHHE